MSAWPIVEIGDVTRIVGGGTPTRGNSSFYDGDIPWVTPKDMKRWIINDSQVRITQEGLDNSAARLAPSNSVLVVVRSGVLKHTLPVALNRRPVAINQDMKALICHESVFPDYLARFIKERSGTILQWVRATTADNFPVANLKNLQMPLPPVEMQRRIVQVLDCVDSLRDKRRQAVALLDELTQSIFLDMFGDPVSNPLELPMSTLGGIGEVQGGLQLSGKRSELPVQVPYLRVANVYRNKLQLGEIKEMRASAAEVERTLLRDGDLLVVEGHGNPREIGRAAIWDGSISPCVHQNHLIRVRVDKRLAHPDFVVHYINSPGGRQHLLGGARTTSGLNTISVSVVKNTPVALPDVEQQSRFADRVAHLDSMRAMHMEHLAELDALFASLQHRAFRGELLPDPAIA
ncbi:restriction endonuclease subunit S [Streptomyces albidoflavus]|uniref:restriction endonuclease subunit S n=1 Tax=Streptomyces albidoflavus TaxID=1886 RepID=UPI0033B76313